MQRRFLRARSTAVDPLIAGDKLVLFGHGPVALVVYLLVFAQQPARPGVRAVVSLVPDHLLLGRVLIPLLGVGIVSDIRLFLRQELVKGLGFLFAFLGIPDARRPAVRRRDPSV